MLNRYRVHKDGRFEFYTFKQNTFNKDVWLEDEGDFELKEDGTRYDFYLEDGKPDLDKELEKEITNTVVAIRAAIAKAIHIMRVEVDGIGYDGDEVSTTRMQKAITSLVGDETTDWRVYDNSEVVVTQTELAKALRASGLMMTKLWFCRSIEAVETIVKADPEWWAKYNA